MRGEGRGNGRLAASREEGEGKRREGKIEIRWVGRGRGGERKRGEA